MEISFDPIEHPSIFVMTLNWTFFLIQGCLCMMAAYLVVYQGMVAKIISAMIKTRLEAHYQPPEMRKLVRELRQLKDELSAISPTGQYAAFVRKEREVNKKLQEFEKEKEKHEGSLPNQMKLDMISKLCVYGTSLILMWSTAQLSIGCLPTAVFFPISYILTLPRIPYFSSDRSGCAEDTSRISLFIIIVMFFTTLKNIQHRKSTAFNG